MKGKRRIFLPKPNIPFKHTVRAKTKEDKNSLHKQIENSVNDQKLFWGLIKKVSRGSLVKTNIPAKSWFDYYSTLLNRKPNNMNLSSDRFVQSYLSTHDRNCSICSGKDSSDYHELLSLLSNLSKIFTGIINKRIVLWSEFKGFLSECQAGFRQKKSTMDQMFILKTMLDRFLFRKRGRFCCIFLLISPKLLIL